MHREAVAAGFAGTRWTQNIGWGDQDPAEWGIRQLVSEGKTGLSTRPGVIHQGGNSGFQSLNLAWHLLSEAGQLPGRVLLLGFDMCPDGGKHHWFGSHQKPLHDPSGFPNWLAHFKTVSEADYQLEIWNVTRRTALKCFPLYDLDDAVALLKKKGPEGPNL